MSTDAQLAPPETVAPKAEQTALESVPEAPRPQPSTWWQALGERLRGLNRATQFVITATIILGITMTFVGSLVSQRIEHDATQSAGEAAALYMEAFLAPYIQELARSRKLSAESTLAIDNLMANTSINEHIVSIKIWLPDGTNIYSTSKLPVFRNYPEDPIQQVMQGKIVTRLGALDNAEHAYERSLNMPLYETYVPLRKVGSGKILAIGEFYEMEHKIDNLRQEVWAVIGAATLAMLLLLFFIVRRGDRIIERQQMTLKSQMQQQTQLHLQNATLQDRITKANHEFSRISELILRRLGADLHDGPAQLLTLVLLRLDELGGLRDRYLQEGDAPGGDALESIRGAGQEALREIRDISRGLALPEINDLSLREELLLVAHRHEQRTDTKVELSLGTLPGDVPLPYKICLYRLAQEALNNAFHHAGGKSQKLSASHNDGLLEVQIEDAGEGIPTADLSTTGRGRTRLGLVGMRYRVESLGGVFSIDSVTGYGTKIKAQFKL
ncbi:MAG: sensor histidine kinase [Pseudomonas sp.]